MNVFRRANNLLLAVDGLPPLPPDPPKHIAPKTAHKKPRKRT